VTGALAVLLHVLVMRAVPWGAGTGSQGGVRPLQVRQIVLPPSTPLAPAALVAPQAAPAPSPGSPPALRRPTPAPLPVTAASTDQPVEPPAPPAEPVLATSVDAAASAPETAALPAPETATAVVEVAAAITAPMGSSPAQAPPVDGVGGAPLPVYATRPAPTTTLRYELRRGGLRGSGELSWRPRADGYALSMRGTAFSLPIIEWTSEGTFDSAGLAPLRFVDRRRARDARAANFQREAGRITFSGPATVYPLVPGAQDRVSWMLQLPAIVDAAPAAFVPGERIGLFVVGARGDADVWTFTVEGTEALDLPAGRVEGALRLRREPRKPHDTRVDVWLDPARHHLPVRVRLSSVDGGDGNEFLLESMTLQP